MPVAGGQATDRHRLVRQVRVVRGTMQFVVDIQPRFDYGRKPHKLELSDDGALFQADGMTLTLHLGGAPGSSSRDQGVTVARDGDGLRATVTLRAGQTGGVVLESMGGAPRRVTPRGTAAPDGRHRPVLAGLAEPLDLHRPLARDGGPLGHDAQTDDLRAHRRARRRADHRAARASSAASATGTTGTPGSGTARSPSTRCSDSAISRRPQPSVAGSRPGRTEQRRRRRRSAEDHVPGRRHARTSSRKHWTTSRAGAVPARYGSATAPPASCNSISTARRWTPSSSATCTACR